MDLDTALEWHLRHNHYPAAPAAFKETCKKAIEIGQQALAEDENEHSHGHSPKWEELVELPMGVQWKHRQDNKAPVGEIIESFHLDSFLHSTIYDEPDIKEVLAPAEEPMRLELTKAELALVLEALDSHMYWQLSEPCDRNDGFIHPCGGAAKEDPEVPADTYCGEHNADIHEATQLRDRLEKLVPRETIVSHAFPVLKNDDGIRPAGRPDECFYCHRRVGEDHAKDCVTIVVDVDYTVFLDDKEIGVYRTQEPSTWTTQNGEFHLNEGSWCVSNLLEAAKFEATKEIKAQLQELHKAKGCLCNAGVTLKELKRGMTPRRTRIRRPEKQ